MLAQLMASGGRVRVLIDGKGGALKEQVRLLAMDALAIFPVEVTGRVDPVIPPSVGRARIVSVVAHDASVVLPRKRLHLAPCQLDRPRRSLLAKLVPHLLHGRCGVTVGLLRDLRLLGAQ